MAIENKNGSLFLGFLQHKYVFSLLKEMQKVRGRGSVKANILEAMYENKLEFPEGRGVAKPKTFHGWGGGGGLGENGYFLELQNTVLYLYKHVFGNVFLPEFLPNKIFKL